MKTEDRNRISKGILNDAFDKLVKAGFNSPSIVIFDDFIHEGHPLSYIGRFISPEVTKELVDQSKEEGIADPKITENFSCEAAYRLLITSLSPEDIMKILGKFVDRTLTNNPDLIESYTLKLTSSNNNGKNNKNKKNKKK